MSVETPKSPENDFDSFDIVDKDVVRREMEEERHDVFSVLEEVGLSFKQNKKKLLYLLLAENPPKYIKSTILARSDSISYQNVLGVFFLLEMVADNLVKKEEIRANPSQFRVSPNSAKFFTWVPYESLMFINERYVVHKKSNGEIVNSVKVKYEKSDDVYISARLREPGLVDYTDSDIDRIPKFNLAVIIPLRELHSIIMNPRSPSVTLNQQEYSFLHSSHSQNSQSYGPFIFQDGGNQNLLDDLEHYMQLYKFPNNNAIFLQEKQTTIDRSVMQMDFDNYFTDVLREEGSSRGLARGFLDWGAKLSKEVNNIQVGIRKYFGKKEVDTRQILKQLERERSQASMSQDQLPEDNVIVTISDDEDYEIISSKATSDLPEWTYDEEKAISLHEWRTVWLINGVIVNPKQLRKEICFRGIADEARPEIWPFLLGFYPWDSTEEQRAEILENARKEYEIYLNQWSSITPRQIEKHSVYKDRLHRIEKDVVRTDRSHPLYKDENSEYLKIIHRILMSYAFYNFDIGYCQGMGDILSPIVAVMKDEVLSFWCYTSIMDNRVHRNFRIDSSGVEAQLQTLSKIIQKLDYELYVYLESRDASHLFFCFRWILVLFKREFEFEEVKRIWECVWTDEYGEDMHIFMCFAILELYRDQIINQGMGFDEILHFSLELSCNLDIKEVMVKTMLCIQLYQALEKSPTTTK